MKTGKGALLATVAVGVLVSGCATQSGQTGSFNKWWECAIAGGVVGGAGGALDKTGTAVGAAAGGALLAGAICALADDEPKAAQPAAKPKPVPAKCKYVVPGWDVAMNGCPADSDGDGIPDPLDKCPGTAMGEKVDKNGCAILEEAHLASVHFALSSSELAANAKAVLDQEVVLMQRYPYTKITLTGFTDSTGPLEFNNKLSVSRAMAVKNYLISQGVDPARITMAGDGPEDPVATNATKEGRMQNRRVQLELKN
ncbi:OmpA family protein [Parendozoicomonas haliclonae]|nr:OmpA family protein [Parendozoicomonas haliclonae]